MSKFYESNELSDVICDECSKVSGTEKKSNFESKQSIVSAPMQLRISLQRKEYNWETESFFKKKKLFQQNIPCIVQMILK